MIHSTAVVHPKARIASSVQIGPGAVIDADVEIGPDCIVGPQVYITGVTSIGARNRFHAGCVIGDAPQDLKYDGAPTRLRIGDENVFREHATVHRSTRADDETRVGSNNFIMAGAHIAHNCQVGNQVIIANGALLGGHAVVGDRVFLSGNCLVHQFTRVGMLALLQGGAGVSKDVPPFTVATETNTLCGLNTVGLRRAGFSPALRLDLKRLYKLVFRSDQPLRTAAAAAQAQFTSPECRQMIDFILAARKGVCADRGRSDGQDEE